MAEKGTLSGDTVSLPPTYAPSEAYTESPPPAYQRPGLAAVRIARLLCCTLLAMTFIVGFFVITHKYIQTRECNCQNQEQLANIQAAALLGAPIMKLDNNKIEDDIASKDAVDVSDKSDETLEEIDLPEDMLIDITNEKNLILPDIPTEEVVEQVQNDLKLPKDMLLGNPKLAGKNVQCRVEKKQQKIGEGIMTQAIIVTCDDKDDEKDERNMKNNDFVPPMALPKPPISIFSTLMKILASKPLPNNDLEDRDRFVPFGRESSPRLFPIIRPIRRPEPFPAPLPLIRIPLNKPEVNEPFHNSLEDKQMPPLFLQRPLPEIIKGNSPRMNVLPPPFARFLRPVGQSQNPFSERRVPIKIVRIPPPAMNEINEDEPVLHKNEPHFNDDEFTPPISPFHRFFPLGKRVIQIRPMPSDEESPQIFPTLPIPEGAVPIPHPFHQDENVPHSMPEASGRALPAPVALPDVKLIRLPLTPQTPPILEQNLMTHMEVRAPEEEETPIDLQSNDEPPSHFEEENGDQNTDDFGPPRTHTLISQPEDFPQQPSEPSQDTKEKKLSLSQLLPQLKPKYSTEGRISKFAKLNSDAEVIPLE